MASSGSVSTNKYEYTGDDGNTSIGVKCSWVSVSQSVADGTTVIDWVLESEGAKGFRFYSNHVHLTINGELVYSTTDRFLMHGGGVWSVSGSLAIAHDIDGTKEFSISIEASIYQWTTNCTGSDTFELDTIARGLVYIDDGSSVAAYQAFIDNGATWDHVIPYIDNGTSWDMCG
jgi:hypothetical protein